MANVPSEGPDWFGYYASRIEASSVNLGRRVESAVNASGNWRITFGWNDGDAIEVDL